MLLRTITSGILLIGALATSSPAAAGDVSWGFRVGLGSPRGHLEIGYRRGLRRHVPRRHSHYVSRLPVRRHHEPLRVYRVHRHRHVPMPVYEEIWIAPIYRTIFCGYDEWGDAVYRRVLVAGGHYRRVVRYHACRGCGARLP